MRSSPVQQLQHYHQQLTHLRCSLEDAFLRVDAIYKIHGLSSQTGFRGAFLASLTELSERVVRLCNATKAGACRSPEVILEDISSDIAHIRDHIQRLRQELSCAESSGPYRGLLTRIQQCFMAITIALQVALEQPYCEPPDHVDEQALAAYSQQQSAVSSPELCARVDEILAKLKLTYARLSSTPRLDDYYKTVVLCYAWPSVTHHPFESRIVEPFVLTLAEHLRQAGIRVQFAFGGASLSSVEKQDVFSYVSTADHVILLCSDTFTDQLQRRGPTAEKEQLSAIIQKASSSHNPHSVICMLMSGTVEMAVPACFRSYAAVEPFYDSGESHYRTHYLLALFNLIGYVYGKEGLADSTYLPDGDDKSWLQQPCVTLYPELEIQRLRSSVLPPQVGAPRHDIGRLPPVQSYGLPQLPLRFVVREKLINRMAQVFVESSDRREQTCVQVISGLSGSGKTTLARYFSGQVEGRQPIGQFHLNYDYIVWLSGQDLKASARRYLSKEWLRPTEDLDDAIEDAIDQIIRSHHSPCLLIVDDVSGASIADVGECVQRITRSGKQIHLLITTCVACGWEEEPYQITEIEGFDSDEVHTFCQSSLRGDVSGWEQLFELFDGHPLALAQALQYIYWARCSISEYLRRYGNEAVQRDVLLGANTGGPGFELRGAGKSAYTNTCLTLGVLEEKHQKHFNTIRDILFGLSFFAPFDVRHGLLLEYLPEYDEIDQVVPALDALESFSLVRVTHRPEVRSDRLSWVYRLHGLTQKVLRLYLQDRGPVIAGENERYRFDYWLQRALNFLKGKVDYRYTDSSTWEAVREIFPHAKAALQLFASSYSVPVPAEVGLSSGISRVWQLGQQFWQGEAASQLPVKSGIVGKASDLAWELGAFQYTIYSDARLAKELYQLALEIHQKLPHFGEPDLLTLRLRRKILAMGENLGEKVELEEFERLASALANEPNVRYSHMAAIYGNIRGKCISILDLDGAEKALKLEESFFEQSRSDGVFFRLEKANYSEAELLHALIESSCLPGRTLRHVVYYCGSGRKWRVGFRSMRGALITHSLKVDSDCRVVHDTFLKDKTNADLNEDPGLQGRVRCALEKVFQDDAKGDQASIAQSWSSLEFLKGNHKAFEARAEQAYKLRVELYGEDHLHTIEALKLLAEKFTQAANYLKAYKYLQRVLDAQMKHYSEDHWELARTLASLIEVTTILGYCAELPSLCARALYIVDSYKGKKPDTIGMVKVVCGFAYNVMGKYEGAAYLLEEALTLLEPHSYFRFSAYFHLHLVYSMLENTERSEHYISEAHQYVQMYLSEFDWRTALVLCFNIKSFAAQLGGEQATTLLAQTEALISEKFGADHPKLYVVYLAKAELSEESIEVIKYLERTLNLIGSIEGSVGIASWGAATMLVQAYLDEIKKYQQISQESRDEAITASAKETELLYAVKAKSVIEKAFQEMESLSGGEASFVMGQLLYLWARWYRQRGELEEAIAKATQSLSVYERTGNKDHIDIYDVLSFLYECVDRQGDYLAGYKLLSRMSELYRVHRHRDIGQYYRIRVYMIEALCYLNEFDRAVGILNELFSDSVVCEDSSIALGVVRTCTSIVEFFWKKEEIKETVERFRTSNHYLAEMPEQGLSEVRIDSIRPDGHCGVYLLHSKIPAASRSDIVQQLLTCKNRPDIRAEFLTEILEIFRAPQEEVFVFSEELMREWLSLFEREQAGEQKLAEIRGLISDELGKDGEELNRYLASLPSSDQRRQRLDEIEAKVSAVQQAITDFCSSERVFEYYIRNGYGGSLHLGVPGIVIYAKQFAISVCVWHLPEGDRKKLTLQSQYPIEGAEDVLHVVHGSGFTHYDSFVVVEPHLPLRHISVFLDMLSRGSGLLQACSAVETTVAEAFELERARTPLLVLLEDSLSCASGHQLYELYKAQQAEDRTRVPSVDTLMMLVAMCRSMLNSGDCEDALSLYIQIMQHIEVYILDQKERDVKAVLLECVNILLQHTHSQLESRLLLEPFEHVIKKIECCFGVLSKRLLAIYDKFVSRFKREYPYKAILVIAKSLLIHAKTSSFSEPHVRAIMDLVGLCAQVGEQGTAVSKVTEFYLGIKAIVEGLQLRDRLSPVMISHFYIQLCTIFSQMQQNPAYKLYCRKIEEMRIEAESLIVGDGRAALPASACQLALPAVPVNAASDMPQNTRAPLLVDEDLAPVLTPLTTQVAAFRLLALGLVKAVNDEKVEEMDNQAAQLKMAIPTMIALAGELRSHVDERVRSVLVTSQQEVSDAFEAIVAVLPDDAELKEWQEQFFTTIGTPNTPAAGSVSPAAMWSEAARHRRMSSEGAGLEVCQPPARGGSRVG